MDGPGKFEKIKTGIMFKSKVLYIKCNAALGAKNFIVLNETSRV